MFLFATAAIKVLTAYYFGNVMLCLCFYGSYLATKLPNTKSQKMGVNIFECAFLLSCVCIAVAKTSHEPLEVMKVAESIH